MLKTNIFTYLVESTPSKQEVRCTVILDIMDKSLKIGRLSMPELHFNRI